MTKLNCPFLAIKPQYTFQFVRITNIFSPNAAKIVHNSSLPFPPPNMQAFTMSNMELRHDEQGGMGQIILSKNCSYARPRPIFSS